MSMGRGVINRRRRRTVNEANKVGVFAPKALHMECQPNSIYQLFNFVS